MNVFEKMEMGKASYTKSEKIIYKALCEKKASAFHESASALAERIGVSQPSISRFCKKLGYNSYNEFRLALYESMKSDDSENEVKEKKDEYKRIIEMLYEQMEEGRYDHLAELLYNARTITSSGFHRSSLPARLLAIELDMLNKYANYKDPNYFVSINTNACPRDIIVLYSQSGDSVSTIAHIAQPLPKEHKPTMVLITMSTKPQFRKLYDEVIWLPDSENQGMPHYIEASVIFSIFTDILSDKVARMMIEREGKTNEDK